MATMAVVDSSVTWSMWLVIGASVVALAITIRWLLRWKDSSWTGPRQAASLFWEFRRGSGGGS